MTFLFYFSLLPILIHWCCSEGLGLVIWSFSGHLVVTCYCHDSPQRVVSALMLYVGGSYHLSYFKRLGSSLDSSLCLDLDGHICTPHFFAIWFRALHKLGLLDCTIGGYLFGLDLGYLYFTVRVGFSSIFLWFINSRYNHL
jgi:hypothetical protein